MVPNIALKLALKLALKTQTLGRVISCLAVITLWGCHGPGQNLHTLRIQVNDQQGNGIGQAHVQLGGKTLGTTDSSGAFSGQFELSDHKVKNLEIRKESKTHFISSYLKTLSSSEIGPDGLTIEATLYTLAKDPLAQQPPEQTSASEAHQLADPPDTSVSEHGLAEQVKTTLIAAAEGPGDEAHDQDTANSKEEQQTKKNTTQNIQDTLADTSQKTQTQTQTQTQKKENLSSPSLTPLSSPTLSTSSASSKPSEPVVSVGQQPQPSASHHKAKIPPLTEKERDLAKLHSLANSTLYEPKPGDLAFSVYEEPVANHHQPKPLRGVKVFIGYQQSIHFFCQTSSEGRCLMDPKERVGRVVSVILQKPGYTSKVLKVQIAHNEHHRFFLKKGGSVDIFALSSHYGSTLGIHNITIKDTDSVLGTTNSFGYFSIPSKNLSLPTTITLSDPKLVPSTKAYTIGDNPSEHLVSTFQHLKPELIRLALFPPEYLGTMAQKSLEITSSLDSHHKFIQSHIFRVGLIRRVGYCRAHSATSPAFSFENAATFGWQGKELSAMADGFISQYFYPKSHGWRSKGKVPAILENRVHISSDGLVDSFSLPVTLPFAEDPSDAIQAMTHKVVRALPYQGTIIQKLGNSFTLNLGYHHRSDHTPQKVAYVYRTQFAPNTTELFEKILVGKLMIQEVKKKQSSAYLYESGGHLTPQIGDLVVIYPQKLTEVVKTDLVVMDQSSLAPLAVVNLYHDHQRVGYTAADGSVMIHQRYLNLPTTFSLQLPGYEITHTKLTPKRSQSQAPRTHPQHPPRTLTLQKLHTFVRIASYPSGLNAYIHGQLVGKTPVKVTKPPRSEVKVTLTPPKGYKGIAQTYQLAGSFLDLTGPSTLRLEKDFISQYYQLMRANKPAQAIKTLAMIPKHHSDQGQALDLLAQAALQSGQTEKSLVYWYELLVQLKQTEPRSVQSFGQSFYQAGMSSFSLAENWDKKKNFHQSALLYSRSIDFLSAAKGHLNPLSDTLGASKLSYHLTLAMHRKALIEKDSVLLERASKSWQNYLATYHLPNGSETAGATDSATQKPANKAEDGSPMLSKASVYAKQASDDLKRKRF